MAWSLAMVAGLGACGHHPPPGTATLAPEDSQLLSNAATMLDNGSGDVAPALPGGD